MYLAVSTMIAKTHLVVIDFWLKSVVQIGMHSYRITYSEYKSESTWTVIDIT